jgi:hypothetical protein
MSSEKKFNIGDEEFMAVVDNIMGALDGNKIE